MVDKQREENCLDNPAEIPQNKRKRGAGESAFPALGKYGGMDANGKDHGGKGVPGARFLGDVSAQYPGDLGPLL